MKIKATDAKKETNLFCGQVLTRTITASQIYSSYDSIVIHQGIMYLALQKPCEEEKNPSLPLVLSSGMWEAQSFHPPISYINQQRIYLYL